MLNANPKFFSFFYHDSTERKLHDAVRKLHDAVRKLHDAVRKQLTSRVD